MHLDYHESSVISCTVSSHTEGHAPSCSVKAACIERKQAFADVATEGNFLCDL